MGESKKTPNGVFFCGGSEIRTHGPRNGLLFSRQVPSTTQPFLQLLMHFLVSFRLGCPMHGALRPVVMPGHYSKYVQKNKGVLECFGMNLITKGIIGIVSVGAVGVGIYLYSTRAVDQSPVPVPVLESSATSESVGATVTEPAGGGVSKQLVIDSAQSRASFSLKEDLNGKRITVLGTTTAITGTAQLNTNTPASLVINQVAIDGRTFVTDNDRRNNAITRFILESEKPEYTYITFTTTAVEGVPALLEDGAEFPLIITGNLSIKGTIKPTTFTGTGTYTEGVLTATVSSIIKYGEFGVSVPQLSFLANVEEEVVAELTIVAR